MLFGHISVNRAELETIYLKIIGELNHCYMCLRNCTEEGPSKSLGQRDLVIHHYHISIMLKMVCSEKLAEYEVWTVAMIVCTDTA